MPDSVSVPLPVLISQAPVPPPGPPSAMTPVTSVERLLPPTVSSLAPRLKVPLPPIEPALSLLSPRGPVDRLKSVVRKAPLVMAALPAVLVFSKYR